MSKSFYPRDVVEQARDVLVGWGQVAPPVLFGSLTPQNLTADVNAAGPLEDRIAMLEKQLADSRGQRDILFNQIWEKVKRVRSGIKANYGDDSQQYEWVGGKRMSDRKPRARKGSNGSTSTATE